MISATNCRSGSQVASTAYQIARAATMYGVSEIIVYESNEEDHTKDNELPPSLDLNPGESAPKGKKIKFDDDDDKTAENTSDTSDSKKNFKKEDESISLQDRLIGFLEYFVTPSYLRKSLFGNQLHHFDIARKFPKLPGLPYLNHSLKGQFLVGLSVPAGSKIKKNQKGKTISSTGRKRKARKSKTNKNEEDNTMTGYINIGEKNFLKLKEDIKVPINSIVVVDKDEKKIVSPEEAFNNPNVSIIRQQSKHESSNLNWTNLGFGYKIRKASKFGKVFTECPFPGGFQYTALVPCMEFLGNKDATAETELNNVPLIEEETFLIKGITSTPGEDVPILMVLGKWTELRECILRDNEDLAGVEQASMLFDGRLRMNRGFRVEDALMAALAKVEGL